MEQAGTEQRTPGPAPRPPPSYLTPPDEPQPLDFSSKRPRLSPPASPSLPGRALPPRRLVSGSPAPALPSSPLPLTLLQQNLKTLTSLHQQPGALTSPLPTPLPSPLSPFLLSPGLCLPVSLLQLMSGQHQPPTRAPSPPAPAPAAAPPQDKAELLKVNSESLGQYALFRQNMLRQLAQKKSLTRRDSSDSGEAAAATAEAGDTRDQAYWERRRKNNLAAKRSRDARRAKEDEIAIRAAFLEQENLQLKWEVARLKTETGRLRSLLLSDSEAEDGLLDPA